MALNDPQIKCEKGKGVYTLNYIVMLLKAKFLQLAVNKQLFCVHFQGVTGIQILYTKIQQATPAPGILLHILSEIYCQQIKLSDCFC